MGFNCGIIGLPNVGKSTLFNALTRTSAAQAANYPFCTIEPNTGRVAVPDERLEIINDIIQAKRVVPSFIEFVDIAGLVKGASRGEGLGNQFLGHIREVSALVQVVRCFDDSDVIHVEGTTDPKRDIDIINTELIFADFETVSKSADKLSRLLKGNDKKNTIWFDCAQRLKTHLDGLKPARTFVTLNDDEKSYLQSLHLLTEKPMLYAANIAENELETQGATNQHLLQLKKIAEQEKAKVIVISAKLEEELSSLSLDDAKTYMADLNINESGLSRLIKEGYDLLNLSTFFTAGVQEVRSWTIPKFCKAPQAAGVIHSDFEKGFICAEVYAYDDLLKYGNVQKIREAGLYRKEGKDYVCQDGDIMNFLFNV